MLQTNNGHGNKTEQKSDPELEVKTGEEMLEQTEEAKMKKYPRLKQSL